MICVFSFRARSFQVPFNSSYQFERALLLQTYTTFDKFGYDEFLSNGGESNKCYDMNHSDLLKILTVIAKLLPQITNEHTYNAI